MVHWAAHAITVRARAFQSCLEVVGQRQTERCGDGNQNRQLNDDPSASEASEPATHLLHQSTDYHSCARPPFPRYMSTDHVVRLFTADVGDLNRSQTEGPGGWSGVVLDGSQ
jgi:hypothetical protein